LFLLVDFGVNMKEQYFNFLDALRDSGQTNMFGAGPWLQRAFGLERHEAKDIVLEWMNTYGERKARKLDKTTTVVETST
jgi:hypothetical protein